MLKLSGCFLLINLVYNTLKSLTNSLNLKLAFIYNALAWTSLTYSSVGSWFDSLEMFFENIVFMVCTPIAFKKKLDGLVKEIALMAFSSYSFEEINELIRN